MFKASVYKVFNIYRLTIWEPRLWFPNSCLRRSVNPWWSPHQSQRNKDNDTQNAFLKHISLWFEKLWLILKLLLLIFFYDILVTNRLLLFLLLIYEPRKKMQPYVTLWLLIFLNDTKSPKSRNHYPTELVKHQTMATRNYIRNMKK